MSFITTTIPEESTIISDPLPISACNSKAVYTHTRHETLVLFIHFVEMETKKKIHAMFENHYFSD